MSHKTDSQPEPSLWTRPIYMPAAVKLVGWVLLWTYVGLVVLITVLTWTFRAVDAWRYRPGVRLALTDSVHIHMPEGFEAFESNGTDDAWLKGYAIYPADKASAGCIIGVDVLDPRSRYYPYLIHGPSAPLDSQKETVEWSHLRYRGMDITASVEPNTTRARLEGAHRLRALVAIDGEHVSISADSATLGVRDSATPADMAKAAVDLLRLDSD